MEPSKNVQKNVGLKISFTKTEFMYENISIQTLNMIFGKKYPIGNDQGFSKHEKIHMCFHKVLTV